MKNSTKKVLICPLDWGLGHASRCVPIIYELLNQKFKVIIAADNLPLEFLKKEFQDVEFVKFPSFYKISYSKKVPFSIKLFFQIPKIILGIYKENIFLKKIINKLNIDIVISDNRFGLFNKNIFTIFITHQILIKMPFYLKFLEFPIYFLNKYIIEKYNLLWIPDNEKSPFFSGDLSHKNKLPKNAKFIGILSRFSINKKNADIFKKKFFIKNADIFKKKFFVKKSHIFKKFFFSKKSRYFQKKFFFQKNADIFKKKFSVKNIQFFEKIFFERSKFKKILIILSGIEPQRTLLENILVENFKHSADKIRLIRGKPNEKKFFKKNNILFFSHLKSDKMKKMIKSSHLIICRSGYSSVMDLLILKKKAILIPTPGQTEQEYLSDFLKSKKLFYSVSQNNFNFEKDLKKIFFFEKKLTFFKKNILKNEIKNLNKI